MLSLFNTGTLLRVLYSRNNKCYDYTITRYEIIPECLGVILIYLYIYLPCNYKIVVTINPAKTYGNITKKLKYISDALIHGLHKSR